MQAPLIDEKKGKDEAVRMGLTVLRRFAILETAATRDLLDLPLTITRLKQTTFRAAPKLYQDMLDRDVLRKRQSQNP